jgi:cytidylate kinase
MSRGQRPVSSNPVSAQVSPGSPDASASGMQQPAVDGGFEGVVALDGPSGTGKSTVARGLASRLGARYLDTGAMYRAATLAVLRAGVDPADATQVVDTVERAGIDISTDPGRPAVALDGARVDAEIRSAEVTAAVSAVSANPAVRALLVAAQRELIEGGPIVVEGRDIGSVVWPTARPKVYLTASASARATRRAGELNDEDVATVAADIDRRDRLDSTRAASPLAKAADAVELDTTDLDVDEVISRLVDMAMDGTGARRG